MSLSQALNKSQGGTNLIVDSLVVGGKPISGTVQQVVGSQYINVFTFEGVSTVDNGGVIEVLGGTGISIGGAAQTPQINNTGVTAVNGLNGGVSFTSPQSTITITPNGQNIQLEAVAAVPTNAVTSLNGLINALTLTSPNITITPDINTGTIDLAAVEPVAVNSLQGLNGTVLLSSPLSTITIGTNGQTIELDAVVPPPITLTAGSGISVGTAPNYTISADPSTLVINDYAQISSALALTGSFASMVSQTLTTTQASAPIAVWGNFNVLNTNGPPIDAVVEARLFCGTTTPTQSGPTIITNIVGNHHQTIPLIFKGVGPAVAGNVTWQLQARVTSGAASRASAQIMMLGQMNNA